LTTLSISNSVICVLAPEVTAVLEEVPEFVDRVLDLAQAADGDPGAPAVFCELADFVASLVTQQDRSAHLLSRCLACVERVARESEDAEELVAWCFLDSLCPEDLKDLGPWLGPRTGAMADRLELGSVCEEPMTCDEP
jgi:hypothetical protein